jgi:hypothetical protein
MSRIHRTPAASSLSTRFAVGPDAHLEGPRAYLEISTCLTALAVAVLAAPPETEPTIAGAFRAQAQAEGLDADEAEAMLMSLTLVAGDE